MSQPRIDKLIPGSFVTLTVYSHSGREYDEQALFLGIIGEGDERLARFSSFGDSPRAYTWEAYRYTGRWAFGSSADRISLSEVIFEPATAVA